MTRNESREAFEKARMQVVACLDAGAEPSPEQARAMLSVALFIAVETIDAMLEIRDALVSRSAV